MSLGFLPFFSECIPAALGCLSPGPPSLIVLASLKTPSENTCSRFTSVLLVLKMARKWLCPDGSKGMPAKKKKNQPGGASTKKTPPLTTPKSSDTVSVPLVEMQFFWWPSWSFFSLLLRMNFPCKTSYVYHTWAPSNILLHFLSLLLLLLLLDIFNPLKPRDTVSKQFGIHASTLSKQMTGKVVGMGCQLGGQRRGRVLTAGEFQLTQ